MTKGIAVTTGLNAVNPAHYGGWSGELNACEADAKDMAEIATSKGFDVKTLLTKEATLKNVIDGINKASSTLTSGDIFDAELFRSRRPTPRPEQRRGRCPG